MEQVDSAIMEVKQVGALSEEAGQIAAALAVFVYFGMKYWNINCRKQCNVGLQRMDVELCNIDGSRLSLSRGDSWDI